MHRSRFDDDRLTNMNRRRAGGELPLKIPVRSTSPSPGRVDDDDAGAKPVRGRNKGVGEKNEAPRTRASSAPQKASSQAAPQEKASVTLQSQASGAAPQSRAQPAAAPQPHTQPRSRSSSGGRRRQRKAAAPATTKKAARAAAATRLQHPRRRTRQERDAQSQSPARATTRSQSPAISRPSTPTLTLLGEEQPLRGEPKKNQGSRFIQDGNMSSSSHEYSQATPRVANRNTQPRPRQPEPRQPELQKQVLHSTAPHLAIALDELCLAGTGIWQDRSGKSLKQPKRKAMTKSSYESSDCDASASSDSDSSDSSSELSLTWKNYGHDDFSISENNGIEQFVKAFEEKGGKKLCWSQPHDNDVIVRLPEADATTMLMDSLMRIPPESATDGEQSASDTSNWLTQYMDESSGDEFDGPLRSRPHRQRMKRRPKPKSPDNLYMSPASASVARSISITSSESLALAPHRPSFGDGSESLIYSETTSVLHKPSDFSISSETLIGQRLLPPSPTTSKLPFRTTYAEYDLNDIGVGRESFDNSRHSNGSKNYLPPSGDRSKSTHATLENSNCEDDETMRSEPRFTPTTATNSSLHSRGSVFDELVVSMHESGINLQLYDPSKSDPQITADTSMHSMSESYEVPKPSLESAPKANVIDPFDISDANLAPSPSSDPRQRESKDSMPSLASMSMSTESTKDRLARAKAAKKRKGKKTKMTKEQRRAPVEVLSVASTLTKSHRGARSSSFDMLESLNGIKVDPLPPTLWSGRPRTLHSTDAVDSSTTEQPRFSPAQLMEKLSAIREDIHVTPRPGLVSTEQLLYRFARPKKPASSLPLNAKASTARMSNRTVDKQVGNNSGGLPSNGLPSNGLPSNGLPSNGLPTNEFSRERLVRSAPSSPSLTRSLLAYENGIAALLPVPSPPPSVSFPSEVDGAAGDKPPKRMSLDKLPDNEEFMMIPPFISHPQRGVNRESSMHTDVSALSMDDTLFSSNSPEKIRKPALKSAMKPTLDPIPDSLLEAPLELKSISLEIPDAPKIPEACLPEHRKHVISSSSHARLSCESPKPTKERSSSRRRGRDKEESKRRSRSNSSSRRKKKNSLFSKLTSPFHRTQQPLPPSMTSTSSSSGPSSGTTAEQARNNNESTSNHNSISLVGSDHWREDSVMLEDSHHKSSIWQRIAVEKERQNVLRARMQQQQAAYVPAVMSWPTTSSSGGDSTPTLRN